MFILIYFALKWVLRKILGKIALKASTNFLLANPRKKFIETKSLKNLFKILFILIGFALKLVVYKILGKGKTLVSGCCSIFSISLRLRLKIEEQPDTNVFPFPNILYSTNLRAKPIRIKSVLN